MESQASSFGIPQPLPDFSDSIAAASTDAAGAAVAPAAATAGNLTWNESLCTPPRAVICATPARVAIAAGNGIVPLPCFEAFDPDGYNEKGGNHRPTTPPSAAAAVCPPCPARSRVVAMVVEPDEPHDAAEEQETAARQRRPLFSRLDSQITLDNNPSTPRTLLVNPKLGISFPKHLTRDPRPLPLAAANTNPFTPKVNKRGIAKELHVNEDNNAIKITHNEPPPKVKKHHHPIYPSCFPYPIENFHFSNNQKQKLELMT